MSIAGHVSRAMLPRYSHVRMEAKRRALDEIATRQKAADDNRQKEAERREQGPILIQSGAVQSRTSRSFGYTSTSSGLTASALRSS